MMAPRRISVGDLDTPVLIVDSEALRANLRRMQERADGFGVRLRPHTKTHKCPEIARLQIETGSTGITVAKTGEAEVMADAGIEDILIANQVVGPAKMPRLIALADRVRLAVLVDSRAGVEVLERAFAAAGVVLDVMIEVDTGKGRCGLEDLAAIEELADAIADAPHLRLRGVETHEGHVAGGVESAGEIGERALAAGRRLVEVAEALRGRGHEIREVSVGSTPAAPYTASVEGVTEMRPGTYVFNDVNQMRIGQAEPEDCAAAVAATVISRPAGDRAVLDAGSKSLWVEPARAGFALPGYEGYGYIRGWPAARIRSLSEEHAVVDTSEAPGFPDVGGRVEVVPNHICPAVNLHDELHLVEDGTVVDRWVIAARGKVR